MAFLDLKKKKRQEVPEAFSIMKKTKSFLFPLPTVNKVGALCGWHSWHTGSKTVTSHRESTDTLMKRVPEMPLS